MFFERIFITSAAVAFGVVVAACSGNPKDKSEPNTSGPVAACQRVNDLCVDVEGFQKQDCSSSDADYAKLSSQEKKQADGMIPCILAAQTCEPALRCVYPNATNDKNASAGSDSSKSKNSTEDACEHINSVCKGAKGFETQDCSHSNTDYQNLSESDQKLADSLVPCIMDAESCDTAFKCLQVK